MVFKGGTVMKEIEELNLPDDIRYAKSHEWAGLTDNGIRVGISDYAQDQLGDIVFVELPQVGETFQKGDEFGTVESVKTVAELMLPVGGTVTSVNGELEGSPGLVNQDPYKDGWMLEMAPAAPSGMGDLMDKTAYLKMLKGLE
jgi:glycine cleavage system H protein